LLRELKQIAVDSDLESTAALDQKERQDLLRLLKKVYQS
ncbi:MarR family transcriptional regulator, partial [Pseudomonas syringae]|nr:MarR family transcriptional regulator [Pseudomonas syringae]